MNQKITHPKTKNFFSGVDNVNTKELNPRKDVIFFIRQFAGAYHVENKLPQAINGIILN